MLFAPVYAQAMSENMWNVCKSSSVHGGYSIRGPDLAQIWTRSDPDLGQIWVRPGPDLDQMWPRYVPDPA